MEKQYHIKTPEQLKEINQFAKEGSALNLAKIWTVKLRRDGASPWDGKVFALFSTERGRKAYIVRQSGAGMTINVSLKYNPALKWCEENLEPVVDG